MRWWLRLRTIRDTHQWGLLRLCHDHIIAFFMTTLQYYRNGNRGVRGRITNFLKLSRIIFPLQLKYNFNQSFLFFPKEIEAEVQ